MADYLQAHGASFFDDLLGGTRLLQSQAETALGELVAAGLVSADSFGGLRALLHAAGAQAQTRRARSTAGDPWTAAGGPLEPDPARCAARARAAARCRASARARAARVHCVAAAAPLWRRVPQVAGARAGVAATVAPAAARLSPPRGAGTDPRRPLRRQQQRRAVRTAGCGGCTALGAPPRKGELLVSLSAADPLNLLGIVTPGARLAALAGNRFLLRDGLPVAIHAAGETQFLEPVAPGDEWSLRSTLLRRTQKPAARDKLQLA